MTTLHKISHVPLLYHPTHVLLIDDDPVFLNSMRGVLDVRTPYKIETNPQKALEYLCHATYRDDVLSSLITETNVEPIEGLEAIEHISVNFGKIRNRLDTPERFEKVILVFVDKQMPQMDGLDWCRQVRARNLRVKLILLTGNAGLDQAVASFNEGIIDGYISKGDRNLHQLMNQYVAKETWEQFVDLGKYLSGLIAHRLMPLQGAAFVEFFFAIWQTQQPSEFYIMDSSCSFLFLNAAGSATYLLVRTAEDFAEVLELAKNSDASDSVLQGLRSRKSFPVTPQSNGYLDLEGKEWDPMMMPTAPILGTELYYALVPYSDLTVFSLDRYFTEVWPLKK